jgi:hypothetical protein
VNAPTAHADCSIRPSSVRLAATPPRIACFPSSTNGRRNRKGEIDPGFLITHKIKLEDGPDAYKMFQEKTDGCIKAVINR